MHEVVTQPRPVSKELNVWVTTAGNPETYRNAGEKQAHVLTHLLGQSLEELEGKIQIYREALEQAGVDPRSRKVTLMLHTYIDSTQVSRHTRSGSRIITLIIYRGNFLIDIQFELTCIQSV